MLTFLLGFPHTAYSAHTGRWILINPARSQTWIIAPDQWWGYRINAEPEDWYHG